MLTAIGRARVGAAAMTALLLVGTAAPYDFESPTPYADADNVIVADFIAYPQRDGAALLWDGAQFIDADDNAYAPPAWFTDGFPNQPLAGRLTDTRRDKNAIVRILNQPKAEMGWRTLSFRAYDLPNADGGYAQRMTQLSELAATGEFWQAETPTVFADAAELTAALNAMYKNGGDGYVLRHKDSAPDAAAGELLLALPYEIAAGDVAEHLPGGGEFAGMMGSMKVRDDAGGEFLIARGFTRQERRDPPPPGARIAFRYKGYTDTGKPKNPIYLHRLPAVEKRIGGVIGAQAVIWFFVCLMLLLAVLDAASHRRGGRRWNFKSVIVSAGLLGTFIGIWWGLYNFDSANIGNSVPALLDGLKLSFVTSIFGIALSILLTVAQTILGQDDDGR